MLLRRREKGCRRIGVDITADSIRCVEVAPGIGITRVDAHTRQVSAGCISSEVRFLERSWNFRGASVFIAISAADILSRVVIIPNHEDEGERVRRLAQLASETVPLESIRYEFLSAPSASSEEQMVFMAFARSSKLLECKTFAHMLGSIPCVIDIDVLALFRLWCAHDSSVSRGTSLILHVEAQSFRLGLFYSALPIRLRVGRFSNSEELCDLIEASVTEGYDLLPNRRLRPERAFVSAPEREGALLRDVFARIQVQEVEVCDLLQRFRLSQRALDNSRIHSVREFAVATALTLEHEY